MKPFPDSLPSCFPLSPWLFVAIRPSSLSGSSERERYFQFTRCKRYYQSVGLPSNCDGLSINFDPVLWREKYEGKRFYGFFCWRCRRRQSFIVCCQPILFPFLFNIASSMNLRNVLFIVYKILGALKWARLLNSAFEAGCRSSFLRESTVAWELSGIKGTCKE